MKNILLLMTDFVYKTALRTGNVVSQYGMHQPKEPEELKRLSKHLIHLDKQER